MTPYFKTNLGTLYCGDCLEVMREMPENSIQTCVTSPPYWGLRDYGVDGQLGLEKTPEEYVSKMVEIFQEVKRVLHNDGTLWLNLGDSYAVSGRGLMGDGTPSDRGNAKQGTNRGTTVGQFNKITWDGLKPKDFVGIAWRVAFALQADGWWLRQDIIWHKPNPMPESVKDRCTKAHEYIFLLSKNKRYYYDANAIKEPVAESSIKRLSQPTLVDQQGSDRVPGKTNGPMKAVGNLSGRNRRSVWTITTKPFKKAHFATFPEKLIEPCILAGASEDSIVLDPFFGAGTTGIVSERFRRKWIGIEMNEEYCEIAKNRIKSKFMWV